MSLSSRNLPLAACVLVALGTDAGAADAYFVPDVALRAEHHENFDLRSGFQGDTQVAGYFADLAATIGWRGERGATSLRPQITIQDYPDRQDLERSNQYLNLRSTYDTLRSEFRLIGRYSREDQYRAEVPEAAFDEFDPEDPTLSESGRVIVYSETQTIVQVRPEYEYRLSERLGVGVDAMYQTVAYDADIPTGRVDYDASLLNGYLAWQMGELTELKTGIYASEYQPDNGFNESSSRGVSLELERRWSETFLGTVEVVAERTEVDRPGAATDESDNWGMTAGLVRQGEVSELRFNVGRTFTPSLGSRATVDQIRLQYSHGLTQRLRFNTAFRAFNREAQGVDISGNDREYLRGDLGLRYNLTPTWYATGGYSYIWQKYENEPRSTDDQVLMFSIGYRGLPPQR